MDFPPLGRYQTSIFSSCPPGALSFFLMQCFLRNPEIEEPQTLKYYVSFHAYSNSRIMIRPEFKDADLAAISPFSGKRYHWKFWIRNLSSLGEKNKYIGASSAYFFHAHSLPSGRQTIFYFFPDRFPTTFLKKAAHLKNRIAISLTPSTPLQLNCQTFILVEMPVRHLYSFARRFPESLIPRSKGVMSMLGAVKSIWFSSIIDGETVIVHLLPVFSPKVHIFTY